MPEVLTKKCTKCGDVKELSDFYKDRIVYDGLTCSCKACKKRYAVEYHLANKDKIKLYQAGRKDEIRRRQAEYQKLPHRKLITRKRREKDPEKYKARWKARNAVASGEISKPSVCSRCPSTEKLEMHHKDYSKPLEVVWVCRMCHVQIHKEIDRQN